MTLFNESSDNGDITIDPTKNYLEELVGEGKKFKTVEELARGKYEADLTVRNREMRLDQIQEDYKKLHEEYKAAAKLQELIDKLETTPSRDENLNSNQSTDDTAKMFDPNEIDSLLNRKLQEAEVNKKKAENRRIVQDKLQEQLGESYQAILKQQINALGLDTSYADNLAETSPAAFFKVFGLDQKDGKETFNSPMRSTERRSDSFTPSTHKRGWSYYEQMRKEKPTVYHDPKTHNQMIKDIQEIGEDRFYNL